MSHSVAELNLIFNCLLILAVNDMTTNHSKTDTATLQTGVMLSFKRFVPLLNTSYGHIPRKASIIDDLLFQKLEDPQSSAEKHFREAREIQADFIKFADPYWRDPTDTPSGQQFACIRRFSSSNNYQCWRLRFKKNAFTWICRRRS